MRRGHNKTRSTVQWLIIAAADVTENCQKSVAVCLFKSAAGVVKRQHQFLSQTRVIRHTVGWVLRPYCTLPQNSCVFLLRLLFRGCKLFFVFCSSVLIFCCFCLLITAATTTTATPKVFLHSLKMTKDVVR